MNIPLLAGLGFTAFGLYMLRYAVGQYSQAMASQKWPCVKGQLLKVHLWGKRNIEGEMKEVNNLVVEYSYEAGGSRQTGDKAAFYTLMYPDTTEFAKKHSQGSQVDVYYDPQKTVDSVLIPGPRPNKPFSDLILGILSTAIGCAIAVAAWTGVIG